MGSVALQRIYACKISEAQGIFWYLMDGVSKNGD